MNASSAPPTAATSTGSEVTQSLMTIRVVEPYCPVKSSIVVKWMMPSTSFGGFGTVEGVHEFAGMMVPMSMFSTSIDRGSTSRRSGEGPPSLEVVISLSVASVIRPSTAPALQRKTSPT